MRVNADTGTAERRPAPLPPGRKADPVRGRDAPLLLRPLSPADAQWAALLHHDHFPGGFLSRLGVPMLRRWYAAACTSPAAIALVAVHPGGGRVGYLLGTSDDEAHRAHLVRRCGAVLTVAVATALLRSPSLAVAFTRTRLLRWTRRALVSARSGPPPAAGGATLCYLVTSPDGRHQGVGTALVRAYEAELRRRGCRRARLVTTAGPDGAGTFYARLGWTFAETARCRDGRLLEVWFRDLTEPPPEPS